MNVLVMLSVQFRCSICMVNSSCFISAKVVQMFPDMAVVTKLVKGLGLRRKRKVTWKRRFSVSDHLNSSIFIF